MLIESGPSSNGDSGSVAGQQQKQQKQRQKEMTFEDVYAAELMDDDDEEDDSDWEPLATTKPLQEVEIVKWFCTNCTMVNFGGAVGDDDDFHCDICGEHKDSGILQRGCYASPFAEDADGDVPEKNREILESCKDNNHVSGTLSSSATAVGFDERMLLHSEIEMKSHPHPERPDRLRAIAASLACAGIFPGRCQPIDVREITKEELKMVHSSDHIKAVEMTSVMFSSYFTPDTYANEHSARAARIAAGLCADLATTILSGCVKNGFALVRPPGHHAGIQHAMGFCLHNNAAVAALAAQAAGAKKVLIVDWDVHHGNGTQEIFDQSKSVLYISLHRHEGGKFYPGTGSVYEVGSAGAEGCCVNIPWSCRGVGDNDYVFAFQNVVLPIDTSLRRSRTIICNETSVKRAYSFLKLSSQSFVASAFAPDFTIISAGFDAARGDPLGCCDVTPTGYAKMTQMLSSLSGGKLLVLLEGGYNLRSISSSAVAVIQVLLGEVPGCELNDVVPSPTGLQTVLEVLKIQMDHWPFLKTSFSQLQSKWSSFLMKNGGKQLGKRGRAVVPLWKWGRSCMVYHHILNRGFRKRAK